MKWASDKLHEHLTYAAQDAAFTARVWQYLKTTASGDTRVAELYRVHKELSRIASEMHTTGLYINKEWLGACRVWCAQAVEEKAERVKAAVGDSDFKTTPHGLRALMFERHRKDGIRCFGLPDPKDKKLFTDESRSTISVSEDALTLLAATVELPPELLKILARWRAYQKEKKRLGYLESNLLEEATGPDGRLRPGWNSCGTDTMRFACRSPNVMNVEQILRCIIGPAPGNCMVHVDKRQLEIRVMGVVAKDKVLMGAIDSGDAGGLDVYSAEACDYFNLDPTKFDPDKNKNDKAVRKSAKIIRLARQYGAQQQTVFLQALLQDPSFTFEAARMLTSKFDKRYHGTVAYWKEEHEGATTRGYSAGRILDGRRYYPSPPELSEAVNYPIQRTAAEMMNIELIELDRRLKAEVPEARIVAQLHDAVDVEAPERLESRVSKIMEDVMNREWTFCGMTRKFPIELKVARHSEGGTWADL